MQCHEVWGGNARVDRAVAMPGLDAWVYARPFADQEFGSALHYVSSGASGLLTRVLLADVGRRSGVASLAHDVRRLVSRSINAVDDARLIDDIDDLLAPSPGEHGDALIATYDAGHRRLTLSNTGHPPPLIYSAFERTWRTLESRPGCSRAVASGRGAGCDRLAVTLGVGDVVVLFTGSLTDAVDMYGHPLGIVGLLDLIQPIVPADPHEFKHDVLDALEDHVGAPQDTDDVTIMLLRANEDDKDEDAVTAAAAAARIAWRILTRPFPGADIPWPDAGPLRPIGRLFRR